MKIRLIPISTALTLLLGAMPGQAQKEPVKADTARFGNPTSTARIYENYLYGVIKKIDDREMILGKTKYGVDQAFKFDRKTKFILHEKPSSKDKLKVGDQVWVDVQKDKKTGDLIAKKVVVGIPVAE